MWLFRLFFWGAHPKKNQGTSVNSNQIWTQGKNIKLQAKISTFQEFSLVLVHIEGEKSENFLGFFFSTYNHYHIFPIKFMF